MANRNVSKAVELRDVFGQILVDLGSAHPEMVVLDADLNTSTRSDLFKRTFPNRFIQVGIAEQNLFGIAAGLASTGFIPFPVTFASFAARRALDQLAVSICFSKLNVKVPGSYAGIPTGKAGASHNSVEDIAVMRALPNLRVADPGDAADLRAIMETAYVTQGPVYFRVVRCSTPDMFPSNHRFAWGKGEVVKPGTDVTLFGTGIMTAKCIRAEEILRRDGIDAEIIHLASIKPIDRELIVESVRRTGCAVTAENASTVGGFGSAVEEVLAESFPVPVRKIGVRDLWIQSAEVEELFSFHRMQPEDIAQAARDVIQLGQTRKENEHVSMDNG
jgi:transketolase